MFRGKTGGAPHDCILSKLLKILKRYSTVGVFRLPVRYNYLMKLEIESHSSILAAEFLLTRL